VGTLAGWGVGGGPPVADSSAGLLIRHALCRMFNPGFVCESIINNHGLTKWQIKVTIKNVSAFTINAGYWHYFGLQIGP
jgi:hypothetical protein